jgi:O-antigen ligase
MPPQLALLLTFGFTGYLLRRDSREQPRLSGALWLPVIWIFFIASRFVSQWLGLLGLPLGESDQASTSSEGNPVDALCFLCLILAGMRVLARRGFRLSWFCRQNIWLAAFLGYCFLAIVWSDFPFVAFKRYVKILGHPVMALVILTESEPEEALRRVLKRAAFLLIPLSICFIKYFPEYGRLYDSYTGQPQVRGVTTNKNELGYGCLIFGLFFFWNLLTLSRIEDRKKRRVELILSVGFICMVAWLLSMAGSSTSLVCMIVGVMILVALGSRFVSKRYIGTTLLLAAIVIVAAESLLGVYASVIGMLGKDPTLTDRTKVWADALNYPINPVLGAGFETFWLGPRLEVLWAKWWWQPNQAHNGYIETYLNLGWIGIFLFSAMILGTYKKCRLELGRNLDFGRFRLMFLIVILIYNYTEATFKALHFVWTMFNIIAIDYARTSASRRSRPANAAAELVPSEQVGGA